jgi:hypothetical protein
LQRVGSTFVWDENVDYVHPTQPEAKTKRSFSEAQVPTINNSGKQVAGGIKYQF